jgi:hypothetical protein
VDANEEEGQEEGNEKGEGLDDEGVGVMGLLQDPASHGLIPSPNVSKTESPSHLDCVGRIAVVFGAS